MQLLFKLTRVNKTYVNNVQGYEYTHGALSSTYEYSTSAAASTSTVRAAGTDSAIQRRDEPRTQHRPKKEGRGVGCGARLDAKPGGVDGSGGGRVVVVVTPDRRTRTTTRTIFSPCPFVCFFHTIGTYLLQNE